MYRVVAMVSLFRILNAFKIKGRKVDAEISYPSSTIAPRHLLTFFTWRKVYMRYTYGLRKLFPENADMPDSAEVAAAEGVGGNPRNNVAADIRRAVAAAADNQRLRAHHRQPRCQAARLPRRIPDSHSIA